MTITNMKPKAEWLSEQKGSNQAAINLALTCGRDIYIQDPAGQMIRASWLETSLAIKALQIVRHLQSQCGDRIAECVRGISFNGDGSAAHVSLDWEDFDLCGASIPEESPSLIRCGSSTCLVTAQLRRCEA